MRFKAEDGSEWEIKTDWASVLKEDNLVIRRIPEKSEFEKWAIKGCEPCENDELQCFREGIRQGRKDGFGKAIDLLNAERDFTLKNATVSAKNADIFNGFYSALKVLTVFRGYD